MRSSVRRWRFMACCRASIPRLRSGRFRPRDRSAALLLPANFPARFLQGVTKTATAGLWSTDYHDVSPRLGFALRLTQNPTILLRGGYGIYYDRPSAGFAEGQLGQQPFSVQQLSFNAQNGGATLQSPFAPLLPPSSSFPIYQPRMAGGGVVHLRRVAAHHRPLHAGVQPEFPVRLGQELSGGGGLRRHAYHAFAGKRRVQPVASGKRAASGQRRLP